MTATELTALLERREVLLAGLILSALILLWLVRRVRRIVKSERPDDALANLAMLIGLGWSSEAVWELTGRAGFPLSLRLLMFFVLETLLVLAMIRAKRAMKVHGRPGRSGRTAWIVASAMALVAAGVADTFAESVLRLIIPLLVTLAWWDGLVGESKQKAEQGATSWRWTPRRLLLAVGAIEPGERDVETVNRERLIQVMTRLEHHRQHGWTRLAGARGARLARLSLTADDDMIDEVRRRVGRSGWFKPTQAETDSRPAISTIAAGRAASARARKVRHHHLVRTLRVAHPRPVVVAAQEPRQDPRATHEVDLVVCAIKDTHPKLPQRRIAHLAATSDATVRRALRRTQASESGAMNGRARELEGAAT